MEEIYASALDWEKNDSLGPLQFNRILKGVLSEIDSSDYQDSECPRIIRKVKVNGEAAPRLKRVQPFRTG